MADLTTSQIDKLGERLRKGPPSEADIRLLDRYRNSFRVAICEVVRVVAEQGLWPTERLTTSRMSIVEKLRRERTRLSKMQDIAGCRIVVPRIVEQDKVVTLLTGLFERTTVIDRREKPSHGYRAVHIIVEIEG